MTLYLAFPQKAILIILFDLFQLCFEQDSNVSHDFPGSNIICLNNQNMMKTPK